MLPPIGAPRRPTPLHTRRPVSDTRPACASSQVDPAPGPAPHQYNYELTRALHSLPATLPPPPRSPAATHAAPPAAAPTPAPAPAPALAPTFVELLRSFDLKVTERLRTFDLDLPELRKTFETDVICHAAVLLNGSLDAKSKFAASQKTRRLKGAKVKAPAAPDSKKGGKMAKGRVLARASASISGANAAASLPPPEAKRLGKGRGKAEPVQGDKTGSQAGASGRRSGSFGSATTDTVATPKSNCAGGQAASPDGRRAGRSGSAYHCAPRPTIGAKQAQG